MADFRLNPKVSFDIYIALNESEARALYALTVYGIDDFLKVFYEHLGTAYLQKHEDGLRELFASVRQSLPPQLEKVDKARKAFQEP